MQRLETRDEGDLEEAQGDLLQPITLIDTWSEPPSRRVELYMDHMVPDMFARAKLGDGRNYRVRLEEWALPRLLYSKIEDTDPYRADLNPLARRYRRLDVVKVRVLAKGSVSGVFGDAPARLAAGDVYVFDMDERALVNSPGSTYQTFYLPKAALPDISGFRHFAADTPVARLARSIVTGLADALPSTPRSFVDELAETGTRTLTALLGADRRAAFESHDMTSTRARAISDHIRSTLTPEGPTAISVCRHFGISRATLYRDMRELGGFETFVAGLRWQACYRELSQVEAARGAVTAVGERWGYIDPSQFSHAFKRRFGISPSEVPPRACNARTVGMENPTPAQASNWARRLANLSSE